MHVVSAGYLVVQRKVVPVPLSAPLSVNHECMACKVALARCALDPLAVLASLCGSSGEILGANLHPLQDVLPKQELLAVAERICITATNQVSVHDPMNVRDKTCTRMQAVL